MDPLTFVQPTTVIGLAGISIVAIVYVILQFDKSHKVAMGKFVDLIEKKDQDYQSFVQERNHQTGDIIQENTKVLIQVGENIRQNTDSIKQLVELHLKK